MTDQTPDIVLVLKCSEKKVMASSFYVYEKMILPLGHHSD